MIKPHLQLKLRTETWAIALIGGVSTNALVENANANPADTFRRLSGAACHDRSRICVPLEVFLKLEGIAGETPDAQIDIESFAWGTSNSTQQPRTGPGTIRIEVRRGGHSDQVARWHRDQTRLTAVRLTSTNSRQPLEITMTDVLVSNLQPSGPARDGVPIGSISFNVTKIEHK